MIHFFSHSSTNISLTSFGGNEHLPFHSGDTKKKYNISFQLNENSGMLLEVNKKLMVHQIVIINCKFLHCYTKNEYFILS